MPSSKPTTFPYTYAAVVDALPRILPSCGFQVVGQDLAQGWIRIRGAGTIMAAGENLTIRAGAPDAWHTTVVVESGVRLGVLTYARTTSNFDTVLKTLNDYLWQYYQAHRAPEAPPPPPPS